MNYNEPGLYEKALMLCVEAHGGVPRRFGGEPYCVHPISVAESLREYDIEYQIVGLLHDIVEDTDVTLDLLRDFGFQEYIIEAVDAITHRENESYDKYIKRCNKNKIARLVKTADMLHNLKDFHLFGKEDQIRKIKKQLLYMMEAGYDN